MAILHASNYLFLWQAKAVLSKIKLCYIFFRCAHFNEQQDNVIKTMFLRGASAKEVLKIIKHTVKYPDQLYTQRDGRKVAVKTYSDEVGELPHLNKEGGLSTRLINTIRVVYLNSRNHRKIYVVTAHPLLK